MQREAPNNISRILALHFGRCVQIDDALDLNRDKTHIVIRMILRHPHNPADIASWGVPVNRLRDVRVTAPDVNRQFCVLDVADERMQERYVFDVALGSLGTVHQILMSGRVEYSKSSGRVRSTFILWCASLRREDSSPRRVPRSLKVYR